MLEDSWYPGWTVFGTDARRGAEGGTDVLAVQWVRPHTSNAGVVGSIPAQGSKIPHAMWQGQKVF